MEGSVEQGLALGSTEGDEGIVEEVGHIEGLQLRNDVDDELGYNFKHLK